MSLEQRLKDAFQRRAGQARVSPEAWDRLERALSQPREGSRSNAILVGALLLGLFSASFVVLWTAFRGADRPTRPSAVIPSEQPSTPDEGVIRNPRVITTVDLAPEGQVSSVLIAEGSVWVASSQTTGMAAGSLVRIDANSNEVLATIPLEAVPIWEVGGEGMAAGAGAIWVTGPGSAADGNAEATLQRIDPATNTITQTLPLGGQSGADVAVGDAAVWVSIFGSDDSVELLRIDPSTGSIVKRILVEGVWIREVFALDGVVVVHSRTRGGFAKSNILTVIDSQTNEVLESRPLEGIAGPFTEFGGSIWAGAPNGRLVRVDPQSASLAGEPLPVPKAVSAASLVAGEGGIWFVGHDPTDQTTPATVNRYNLETNELDVSVDPPHDPIALALGPGSVWVLNLEGSVTRVDLR